MEFVIKKPHGYYLSYTSILISLTIIFIFKTHADYSSYKPIMIIYIKTHGNITLFHHSGSLPFLI